MEEGAAQAFIERVAEPLPGGWVGGNKEKKKHNFKHNLYTDAVKRRV